MLPGTISSCPGYFHALPKLQKPGLRLLKYKGEWKDAKHGSMYNKNPDGSCNLPVDVMRHNATVSKLDLDLDHLHKFKSLKRADDVKYGCVQVYIGFVVGAGITRRVGLSRHRQVTRYEGHGHVW